MVLDGPWSLVVWVMDIDTNTWCCMVMDSDVALRSNIGWNFTMALCGREVYSQQSIPLYHHISSSGSTSLHNAQTILLLFLTHISTTYLYIVVDTSMAGSSMGYLWLTCIKIFSILSAFIFRSLIYFLLFKLSKLRILIWSHPFLALDHKVL